MNDERYAARPILAASFCLGDFEIVVRGLDELDIEEVCSAICRDHDEVFDSAPTVILLETIRKIAEAEGKYIRQTGGSCNYGHVKLRLEPALEGSGFEFIDALPEGVVPIEYAAAAEVGIREAARGGVLFGYEVVDVTATLFDASYHDKDSNAMAFQIAGSKAFKEAARKANPVLLEPVMAIETLVDEAHAASVVADINVRRGRVESIEPHAGLLEFQALVPLSEMLRSSRYGRPDYPMRFARYEATRRPPDGFSEDDPGVTANLPKSPHLRSSHAEAQPDFNFD